MSEGMKVSQIPFANDVWEIIKEHLDNLLRGITGIETVSFDFSANQTKPGMVMINGGKYDEVKLTIDHSKAVKITEALCREYEIPFYNLNHLHFTLDSSEIPLFQVSLYPINSLKEYYRNEPLKGGDHIAE